MRWVRRGEAAGSEIAVESLSLAGELALREAGFSFQFSTFSWDQADVFGELEGTVDGWLEHIYKRFPSSAVEALNDLIGVDFRRALTIDLKICLLKNLRVFVGLDRLLRDHSGLLIISDGSLESRFLYFLARRRNLRVIEIKIRSSLVAAYSPGKLIGSLRRRLSPGNKIRFFLACLRNTFLSPGASPSMMKETILVYGVERFISFFAELNKSAPDRLLVYPLGPDSKTVARKYSRQIREEFSVGTFFLLAAIAVKRLKIRNEVRKISRGLSVELPWKGYDLGEVLFPLVEAKFRGLLPEMGRRCLLFARFFEVCRVRRIVFWIESKWREKVLVLLARKEGITTITLPHGAPVGSIGYLPVDVDYVITWGDIHDRWYRAKGVAEDKLVPLGGPQLDRYFNRNKSLDRARVRKRLNLEPVDFISVLAFSGRSPFCLNTSYRDFPALGEEFLKITSTLSSHFTFWKVHPAGFEDLEVYLKFMTDSPGRFVIDKYPDNPKLLNGCDALFTHESSIAIEAMITRTPVFVLNFWKRRLVLPYIKFMPECVIEDKKELIGAIERLREDESFRNDLIGRQNAFLDEYLSGQTSASSKRIAEWVVSVNKRTG